MLILERMYFKTIYFLYILFHALKISKKHKIDIIIERGDSRGIGGFLSLITQKAMIMEVRDKFQSNISKKRASYILAYDRDVVNGKEFSSKMK